MQHSAPPTLLRFLIGGVIGALATWLLWVPLCTFWLPYANGDHWFMKKTYDVKDQALEASDSPRIVLVGASSVFCGFQASVLSEELGRPVVNYACNYIIDVDFQIERLLPHLQAGDILVLPLEHSQYERGWARTPAYLRFIAVIDPETGSRLAGALHSRVAARTDPTWLIANPPILGAFQRSFEEEVSPEGDCARNKPAKPGSFQAEEKAASLARPLEAAPANIANCALWKRNVPRIKTLQEKGVLVVAGYANYFDNPAYKDASWKAFYAEVEAGWKQLAVPVIGQPSDGFVPEDQIYNGRSHLVISAAATRSRRFAEQLRPFLN